MTRDIDDIKALLETERLNGHLNDTDEPNRLWWFVQDVICVGALAVLVAGWMIFAAIQSPDLSSIPEYKTIED